MAVAQDSASPGRPEVAVPSPARVARRGPLLDRASLDGARRWSRDRLAGLGGVAGRAGRSQPARSGAGRGAGRGRVTAVHQLLPALLPGDAVGSHSLQLKETMLQAGLESEIYCEAVHHELDGQGRHFSELPKPDPSGSTVLVYQFAIGSVLADVAHSRPEPLVVDYHNVTPASYFRPWDAQVAGALTLARAQLDFLAARCALGIGDSSFNRDELDERGYAPTDVVPILLDLDSLGGEPDRATLDRLARAKGDGGADWLFVGRLAPNKAQQDLVKALAAYRSVYDPKARLHLVGRPATPGYADGLRRLAAGAGLVDAVELVDQGISHRSLVAYYRSADVLVSASEHEGFCVPLLEAMYHGVPVVAYGAAAVPETLGAAGLLLDDKSPVTVAAAVHRVLSDQDLRQHLVAAGQARLGAFSLDRSRARLVAALAPLTGVSGPAGAGGAGTEPRAARP
ncbi:MAG: glycosyltransferase [Acidimicrobiales bacterium]